VCVFVYSDVFIDSVAECRHSQIVTVSSLLLHVSAGERTTLQHILLAFPVNITL